ncbi:hypothetical protein [Streptomyces sp. NPDC050564]|uniref:hypothetical protein n=1 Tax=Streptomyces sp. NPDC050564 TaxID=3365631 RepID=UPI0037A6B3A9
MPCPGATRPVAVRLTAVYGGGRSAAPVHGRGPRRIGAVTPVEAAVRPAGADGPEEPALPGLKAR